MVTSKANKMIADELDEIAEWVTSIETGIIKNGTILDTLKTEINWLKAECENWKAVADHRRDVLIDMHSARRSHRLDDVKAPGVPAKFTPIYVSREEINATDRSDIRRPFYLGDVKVTGVPGLPFVDRVDFITRGDGAFSITAYLGDKEVLKIEN